MRIGTANGGYARYGDDIYKKLSSFGYSAVDFSMADTDLFLYTSSQKEVEHYLLQQKNAAAQFGIEIWQVHGPWRWPPRDNTAAERAERMEKMKRSIEMTAALGCKNWVIHPLEPFGINDMQTGGEDKTFEINFSFFKELLPIAKEYDVTICLENMPWNKFSMASPLQVLEFVKRIDDDNFKVCLDIGHAAALDLSAGDSVRLIKNNLCVMHVHDSRPGMDLHMLPYFGITDWADFRAALKEISFEGVLSLETAPSSKLPDPIFQEMSVTLAKIAKNIAE